MFWDIFKSKKHEEKSESVEGRHDYTNFDPSTEDKNYKFGELYDLAQLKVELEENGKLSERDEAYYKVLKWKSEYWAEHYLNELKEEVREFSNQMETVIKTINKNPDLLVTENNYQEMKSLLKNLELIMKTYGNDRQKLLRERIESEINDAIEEIDLYTPNDLKEDEFLNRTDLDEGTYQEIENYITYKYNLKGMQTTINEIKRNIKKAQKIRVQKQSQGFFAQREQNNQYLSEDLNTKKTFYIYHIQIGKGILGYGITNSPKRRHKEHMKNFSEHGIVAEKIYQIRGDSKFIEDLEVKIKRKFPQVDIGIDGFKNETTSYEYKNELINFIDYLEDNAG